jgi:hypothetical protein
VATIRSFFLEGPTGRLEALLNEGREDSKFAALVCHPHPLGGGTMHNKVVYRAMKALNAFGMPVLRFNFRGTGLSEGQHDFGQGEQDDVRHAIDWLDEKFGKPMLFAGFSFGAAVGLRVACPDERVKGLIGLGLPVESEGRRYEYPWLASCSKPKLFVSGDRDQYGPKVLVEDVVAHAAEEKELVWVPEVDHFFTGRGSEGLDEMQSAIRTWAEQRFGLASKLN